MKKYLLLALFNIFLAIGSAHAQTDHITVDIPFDFIAGDTTFHAGRYTLHPIDTNGNNLLLRSSSDLNSSAILSPCLCVSERTAEIPGESKLVFKTAGGQRYLWQIWTEGYDVGRELPLNMPDPELATAVQGEAVAIPAVIFP